MQNKLILTEIKEQLPRASLMMVETVSISQNHLNRYPKTWMGRT
jgi:hypothetical protein